MIKIIIIIIKKNNNNNGRNKSGKLENSEEIKLIDNDK